eukprot:gene35202-45590_t
MDTVFPTDSIINAVVLIVATLVILFLLSKFTIQDRRTTSSSKSSTTSNKKPVPVRPEGPFSLEEVGKHNTREDCWIIVDGSVYDVTTYVDDHPGGDSILNNAGKDSSEGVHGPQHPVSMYDVLALYKIGELSK